MYTERQQKQQHTYSDPDIVSAQLKSQFPLSLENMQGVASAIYSAFSGVSTLHPKGFRGTKAWADGTHALRSVLIPIGWHPEDPQGQPRIVSKDQKLAITVSSGNYDTGNPDPDVMPKTRNDKGDQTAKSVDYNSRQMLLFPTDEASIPVIADANGQALWIFLYFIDLKQRQIRFELSKPTNMSETNKIDSWVLRLIMPPLSFDTDFLPPPEDDGEDIEIEITPKYL